MCQRCAALFNAGIGERAAAASQEETKVRAQPDADCKAAALTPEQAVLSRGIPFRDELVTRWAVFFEALKLTWDYRRVGFDLGPRGWYVPDFWIRDWGLYIGVSDKTSHHKPECEGWKISELAIQLGIPGLHIRGEPRIGAHIIDDHRDDAKYRDSNELHYSMFGEFAQCRRCNATVLLADDDFHGFGVWMEHAVDEHTCENHDKWPCSGSLGHAYQAAASARLFRSAGPGGYGL